MEEVFAELSFSRVKNQQTYQSYCSEVFEFELFLCPEKVFERNLAVVALGK